MIQGDGASRDELDVTTAKCYVRNRTSNVRDANNFTQMVWRDSEKIAFGVRSPWVVAWYCKGGNKPAVGDTGSAASYRKNVARTCIVGGMNVCYNRLALNAHNDKRKRHENTPNINKYDEAARAIQKFMDAEGFKGVMPNTNDRPEAFRDCAQNQFTMTDKKKVEFLSTGENGADFATDYWYSQGNANINYVTGKVIANGS